MIRFARRAVLAAVAVATLAANPTLFTKLSYNAETDFSPISMVGVTPNLLICNNDQPAKTLKDLVALCRARPGHVTFGSSGPASAQHLALELFKFQAKVFALHIPYRGSGPLITDLIGGQVMYSFETMTAATPHVKGGKVVALGTTGLRRSQAAPQFPTFAEQGYPGFDATTWYGLAGPGKMSPAIVQRMNEDVNKVLLMPEATS